MKRISITTIFFCLIALAAQAQADQRWMTVSKDGRAALDLQSMRYRPSGSVATSVTFWLRTKYADGSVAMTKYEIHREGRYRYLAFHAYSADGETLKAIDTPGEWEDEMIPESVMEVLYKYLFPAQKQPKGERY